MERSNDPRNRRKSSKRAEQTAQSLIAALLLGTASGCATIDNGAPVVNARPARPAAVVYVQRGDTLQLIARRYKVTPQAIIETNGLNRPFVLARGQRIVIPPAYVAAQWQPQTNVEAKPRQRPRKPVAAVVPENDIDFEPALPPAPAPKSRATARVAPVKAQALAAPPVVESGEEVGDPRLEGARYYALGTPRTKPMFEAQGEPDETATPRFADVSPRAKPKADADALDLDAAYVPPKAKKAERDPDLAYDEKPKSKRDAATREFEMGSASGRFIWPVKGKVLANFGRRGSGLHNDGINIAAEPNTPVKAADAGTVIYAGNELTAYGNLLLVRHANGYVTAYAHNKKLLVGRGDRVKQGQAIAHVGSTGDVDRPQLHFEIRKGERAVDPNRYLIRETASR
jgi:murein DD-endopeptidase MepM/ murein hydrolase activator NlpD